MKTAGDEVESVKENLMKMNFVEEDIKVLKDPKCADVKKAFNDIMEDCWVSNINQEKILVYFYFIGHGAQDTTCQIVLNGADQVFPIEQMLKIVSSFKDSYVLSLMDCTRKRVDPTVWDTTEDFTALSAEMIDQFASQDCFNQKAKSNCIFTYVCRPSADIPAKPTTQVFYFKHIMLNKDEDDKVELPAKLQTFLGTDKKSELMMDVIQPLQITWIGTDYGELQHDQHKEYSDCEYWGQLDNEGLRHGIGKLVFKSGTSYEGEHWHGKYKGQGIMVFASGNVYDGEWRDGVRNGCGESRYANKDRYVGTFKNDKKHGEGSYFYKNGNVYVGGWNMDSRDGKGTYIFVNGEYYNGDYVMNKREGYAVYRNANGEAYEGEYAAGKRNGKGKYTYNSGAVYDGGWKEDKKHGDGQYIFPDGERYEGQYNEGVRHGTGKYFYKCGDIYDGPWVNDERHGSADYTFANGKKRIGEFDQGEFKKWTD